MHVQFFGACKQVTGSQHIIEVNNKKILLECGFFQGRRKEAERINRNFPFDPKSIDAMILSHAHIDHCGNIPNLVKQGFKGPIYCTHATKSIAKVMLEDSAHIQVHDVSYLNKKHKQGLTQLEPIYDINDVGPAVKLFEGKEYDRWFEVLPGAKALFQDAGHVLGSALVTLEINQESDRSQAPKLRSLAPVRLGFTGDLGRYFLPILKDPEQITSKVDYLISESTYGDRLHDDAATSYTALADAINETYKKGGKVIIPSFALERAQEIIYIIHELMDHGRIPRLSVFVDSPLTTKLSDIFSDYPDLLDQETKRTFLAKGEDPFNFPELDFIESVKISKGLNFISRPCVILAASGMCEFGRIVHHLKHNLGDPKNAVIIVGFMAENTLGRKLVEGAKEVNILDKKIKVKAGIVVLNSLSAHADQRDLVNFIKRTCPLKKLFLVHGEDKGIYALRDKITTHDIQEIVVPEAGDRFELF